MVTRFQKEISLIIIIKVIAIGVIWAVWFSDRPTPQMAEHLMFNPAPAIHQGQ